MSKGVVQLLLEVLCMWLKRKNRIFSFPGAFGIWDLGSFLMGMLCTWDKKAVSTTNQPVDFKATNSRTASGELWSKARWLGIRWICLGFVWMQQKHELYMG